MRAHASVGWPSDETLSHNPGGSKERGCGHRKLNLVTQGQQKENTHDLVDSS